MTVDDRLRQAARELRMASSDVSSGLDLRARRKWPVAMGLGLAIAVVVAVIAESALHGGGSVVSVGSPSAKTSATINPASLSLMNKRLSEYMQAVDTADSTAALRAGHPNWWQGSTNTGPVVDGGTVIAVAAFSWDPRSPVLVLSYSGGEWRPIAYPPDPWCPCQDSAPNPSTIDLRLPIQVGDVTGDGRPDFLISMTAADTTPGAVLSQDGAAPGQWRYVPFTGSFPTTTKLGGSPSIQADHLVSTFNECQPSCALGQKFQITWTYQPATGEFSATSSYSLLPKTPPPPTDVGVLQGFAPESSTTWWAIVRSSLDSHAYVVRTTDSGQSWRNVFTPAGQAISASVFLSPDTALIAPGDQAGSPALYRTTNGGGSWQKVGTDPGGCELEFVDLLHGWCINIGAAGGSETVGLQRTTDGGATWTEVSSTGLSTGGSSTPGSLPFACDKTIIFTSDTVGWASSSFCNGGNPYLYRTVDAGIHWYPLPTIPLPAGTATPAGAGLSQPAVQGSNLAVAETIGGSPATVIAASANNGQSWKSQLISSPTQAWNVDLIDPAHWRLTNGDEIMATDDAGAHWRTWTPTAAMKGPGTFGGADRFDFLTPLQGWALPGSDGGGPFWWTDDGGTAWKPVKIVAGPYVFPP